MKILTLLFVVIVISSPLQPLYSRLLLRIGYSAVACGFVSHDTMRIIFKLLNVHLYNQMGTVCTIFAPSCFYTDSERLLVAPDVMVAILDDG